MEQDRLYKNVARDILAELREGRYPVGSRLPAERELAAQFNVSRPTIREAIIALEVQGYLEVRVGSGAHVSAVPNDANDGRFHVSAIELTEARLLIEGEAAALAATTISDEQLSALEELVKQIEDENNALGGAEKADRAFHVAIAEATRNQALVEAIDRLWNLRDSSPEAALLHRKARIANIKPVVDEHQQILHALQQRDPAAARSAMRAHLGQVLESLLFAMEEKAIVEARSAAKSKRDQYARLVA